MDPAELAVFVRDVPDHPSPGIVFRDITPLLADARAFGAAVEGLAAGLDELGVDHVVGVEARGFLFAAPVAVTLGAGLVPVRKPGKLPWQTIAESYELEYGVDELEVHVDAVEVGHRVAIVDDVLATGGTAAATRSLLERAGATVVAAHFLIELAFLDGRARLEGTPVQSMLRYA